MSSMGTEPSAPGSLIASGEHELVVGGGGAGGVVGVVVVGGGGAGAPGPPVSRARKFTVLRPGPAPERVPPVSCARVRASVRPAAFGRRRQRSPDVAGGGRPRWTWRQARLRACRGRRPSGWERQRAGDGRMVVAGPGRAARPWPMPAPGPSLRGGSHEPPRSPRRARLVRTSPGGRAAAPPARSLGRDRRSVAHRRRSCATPPHDPEARGPRRRARAQGAVLGAAGRWRRRTQDPAARSRPPARRPREGAPPASALAAPRRAARRAEVSPEPHVVAPPAERRRSAESRGLPYPAHVWPRPSRTHAQRGRRQRASFPERRRLAAGRAPTAKPVPPAPRRPRALVRPWTRGRDPRPTATRRARAPRPASGGRPPARRPPVATELPARDEFPRNRHAALPRDDHPVSLRESGRRRPPASFPPSGYPRRASASRPLPPGRRWRPRRQVRHAARRRRGVRSHRHRPRSWSPPRHEPHLRHEARSSVTLWTPPPLER